MKLKSVRREKLIEKTEMYQRRDLTIVQTNPQTEHNQTEKESKKKLALRSPGARIHEDV